METKSSDPSPQPPAVSSGQVNTTQNAQNAKGVSGVLGSFTKGILSTSQFAVKAVQVKARHLVSQNKRRYQVAYQTSISKNADCRNKLKYFISLSISV